MSFVFYSPDYITSDWKRQALVLGCAPFSERHNASNIAEWVVKELDDWRLSHVTAMINFCNALREVKAELDPQATALLLR